jgi:phosphosulfolactate synthase (CoM biosynthesis protein A)
MEGSEAVDQYISECTKIGFDIVEISTGFITVLVDNVVRLVEKVQKAGMKAKPEIGIQFGAEGTTAGSELEAEGTQDLCFRIDSEFPCDD